MMYIIAQMHYFVKPLFSVILKWGHMAYNFAWFNLYECFLTCNIMRKFLKSRKIHAFWRRKPKK